MTITIFGSIRFVKEMEEWQKKLINEGFEVFVQGGLRDLKDNKEVSQTEEELKQITSSNSINSDYELIKQSEGVLILNYDKDLVEPRILMQIGFVFTLNRDIFLLNPLSPSPSSAEINAMQPIIIDNDVDKITKYYDNLPKVFLSSESVIKVKATSLAFREFNKRMRVVGFKTKSGVNEQPNSIEETHLGAQNRLENLKVITKDKDALYYISIESGIANIHPEYNYFGLSVCIIEDSQGKSAVTIDTDLEMPKIMSDLVPSKYPDLGVLVQKEFGVKNKDPYIYFTNGKISRDKLIFNSVVNTLASMNQT